MKYPGIPYISPIIVLITSLFSSATNIRSYFLEVDNKNINNPFDADVSPEYMQWSQWHHKQLEQSLSRLSVPITSTSFPILKKESQQTTHSSVIASVYEKAEHTTNSSITTHQFTLDPIDKDEGMLHLQLNESYMNMTTNTTDVGITYTTGVAALLATLTAITSFITVSGNLLVLLSFFVERALRTATNYFIASLAVTDLLIGIFSMNFYTLYLILGHWPLGRLSCDLWLSLDYTACLTSQYTVLIITIDRFFSVRLPAKYRNWRTDRKVTIMVAATWLIPSSVFFTTIMGWPYFNSQVLPRPQTECYAEFSNDPIFNTIFTLCYFWVTLFVMIGLYVGIYKVALNLQKRSDEKRNRVSGLLTQSTRDTPGISPALVNTMKNEVANKNQIKNKNQQIVHSSSAANESSGFDSDDEQPKPIVTAKLPSNVTNKNMSDNTTKCITNFKSIMPSTNLVNGNGKQPVITNNLSAKITIQPVLLEHDGKFDLPVFPKKSKVIPVVPKVPPKLPCPVHGRPSVISLNGQGDSCKYSPASVFLHQTCGLQINSPLLNDEDSGFEANGLWLDKPIFDYLPCSPALCTCSDVEEEQEVVVCAKETVETPVKTNNAISQTTTSNRDISTHPDIAADPSELEQPTDILSTPPQKDLEYQDRVMENFLRRMAVMKSLPDSESRNLNNPNFSNPSSKQPNTARHNQTVLNKQANGGRLDIQRTATTTENTRTPQHPYADARSVGDGEVDTAPLWVPQTMRIELQHSLSSSIREIPCCCSHPHLDYCDNQPQCLICANQQESETPQSSSSYADYVETGLESVQCYCQLNIKRNNKSTNLFSQVKEKISRIPINQTHLIVLNRIKSCFCGTNKQKSKKAPVERGRRENRARKALRTITFILGAFVLCWTPYHILIMIKGICDDVIRKHTCVNDILYSITYWLCYMNSPINPFCYALANAQFKKTFLRIFHGDFRRT